MTFKDQLKRLIHINKTPKRIISLVPSQTELLVDLGLRDVIVGITKFCMHPNDLRKQKAIVGGTKTIKVEKIKALQPDIILCNKEENSKEIVESLKGIAPIHISDIYTLDDALELIRMYGDMFKVQHEASELISQIQSERAQFNKKCNTTKKRKVAYFIWRKPWMVAASDTFIDNMLNEANFENIFKDATRYPEISLDNKKLAEADLFMLSSEPYPFKEKHIKELQQKYPNTKIILVDGELFSWYGSRLRFTFRYFASL